jgi:hypothetical protein
MLKKATSMGYEGQKIMPKCFLYNSEEGPFVNITKDIYLCSKCLEKAEKGGSK